MPWRARCRAAGRTTPRWPVALEVDGGGQERRAGAQGERGRAARERGALAEELDLDAVAGEVAVAEQAEDVVVLEGPHALGWPADGPERHDLDAELPGAGPTNHSASSGGSTGSTTAVTWRCLDLGQPERGPLPAAEVGQGQDHAACPASSAGLDVLVALDA